MDSIAQELKKISRELKGINLSLQAMWHSRYKNEETHVMNPEAYADEYITIEEASARLSVPMSTIRNWIAIGRHRKRGWKEGIHYVNVCMDDRKRGILRVCWSALVKDMAKHPLNNHAFRDTPRPSYVAMEREDDLADPDFNPVQ